MKAHCFLLVLVVALFSTAAYTATFQIKLDGTGDSTSIQAAIDVSTDGDEIVVHPGTYHERIHFTGKNIIVRSTDPSDPAIVGSTILSGRGLYYQTAIVGFQGSEDETCELLGVTIRDGYTREYRGGGVDGGGSVYSEHEGSHACIRNCIITENTIDGIYDAYGAGIFGFDGLVENCIISNNRALGDSREIAYWPISHGGGLAYCNGTIDGCAIRNNNALIGGGLYACNGTIHNCHILDNEAGREADIREAVYGYGGGLAECMATIEDCLITGNRAKDGGGLYECRVSAAGCTISTNEALDAPDDAFPDGYGGGLCECGGELTDCEISGNTADWYSGLYRWDGYINRCTIAQNEPGGMCSGSGEIRNSLIVGNTNGPGIGGFGGLVVNTTVAGNGFPDSSCGGISACGVSIWNSIIHSNYGADYDADCVDQIEPFNSCIGGWPGEGDGNTSEDPLFVDPDNGDYRLQSGSPCINAGDDALVSDDMDVSGNPRIVGVRVDMGAIEHLDGCYLHAKSEQRIYRTGDTATLTIELGNFGETKVVDLIVALQLPDMSLIYLPSLSRDWSRFVSGIVMADGFRIGPTETFSHTFVPQDMPGRYVFYSALVSSGQTDLAGLQTVIEIESFVLLEDEAPVIHVIQDGSGAVRTITAALDLAKEGDVIVVHPGVYCEALQIGGKNVTLTSLDPTDPEVVESTVIDGDDRFRPITFSGTENETCGVYGFTIANGYANCGGGISCGPPDGPHCSATIQNCVIRDSVALYAGGAVSGGEGQIANCLIDNNDADQIGGGLYHFRGQLCSCRIERNTAGSCGGGLSQCDLEISGCEVRRNHAGIPWGGWDHGNGCGGGLYRCQGRISSCVIERNSAAYGGGLDGCDVEIWRSKIVDNSADIGGGLCRSDLLVEGSMISDNYAGNYYANPMTGEGGGLYDCNGTISTSMISSNRALLWGGGFNCCSMNILNCIIAANVAERCSGGGVTCGREQGTMVNCTVTGNCAKSCGGGISQTDVLIVDCIIWGNSAESDPNLCACPDPSFCCIGGWTGGGEGNISDDPMLVAGAIGDHYLHPDSPCIDAGSRSAENAGLADQTTQADCAPDSGRVDIGFHYEIPPGALPEAMIDSISPNPAIRGLDVVRFTGHASDPNGAIVAVEWFSDLDGILGEEAELHLSALTLTPGIHSVRFRAMDDDKTWSVPDYQTLTVELYPFRQVFVNGETGDDLNDGRANSPFKTIAQAIRLVSGDENNPGLVSVASGTYSASTNGEAFPINLPSWVALSGDDPTTTILDAEKRAEHVIYCDGVEGVTIQGFKITGGACFGPISTEQFGAGIFCRDSSVEIIDNFMIANEAQDRGGALYCFRCSLLLSDNKIAQNSAESGGGIYCCVCTGCIIGNEVTSNCASCGGGIRCYLTDLPIENNLIMGNAATGSSGAGGGISMLECTSPIAHNTIAHNASYNGGGIHSTGGDFPPIRDCIIWGNTATTDPNLSDSAEPSYCCIEGWAGGGEGNIHNHPMFVSGPLGDYYLDPLGPCVDAGSRSAEEAGLSARATQADGTPDTGIVDMGYHYPLP